MDIIYSHILLLILNIHLCTFEQTHAILTTSIDHEFLTANSSKFILLTSARPIDLIDTGSIVLISVRSIIAV